MKFEFIALDSGGEERRGPGSSRRPLAGEVEDVEDGDERERPPPVDESEGRALELREEARKNRQRDEEDEEDGRSLFPDGAEDVG